MNKISDFLGTFRNGFQRANRFVCQVIVTPTLVTNIIADSVTGRRGFLGVVDRVLSAENAIRSVPQVVQWLDVRQVFLCGHHNLNLVC